MSENIKCLSCGSFIEKDSKFCKICGAKTIADSIPKKDDKVSLLIRSANFAEDAADANEACYIYVKKFPNDKYVSDMQVTHSIISTTIHLILLLQGKSKEVDDQTFTINSNRLKVFKEGIQDILKNGIVTVSNVKNAKKRQKALETIQVIREQNANPLVKMFQEVKNEADSLLVNGKTRAAIEKKTMEDVYDDAEIYWSSYQNGDLEDALKGFLHLKQLNPFDAYFRNMTGVLLNETGKWDDALKEYLFGLSLDPGNPNLTWNVMRDLTARDLHGASLEIWQHYKKYRQPNLATDIDEQMELFATVSKIIMTGLANSFAGVINDDLASDSPKFIEELQFIERLWLVIPNIERIGGTSDSVINSKSLFISYRKDDCADMASRIQSKLKTDNPMARVFLDSTLMKGGEKFTEQIKEEIANSDVLLLLVGNYWNTDMSRRRLFDSKDILRREISWAIKKGVSIIPILINNTEMPSSRMLPEEIREVIQLHAERIRSSKFEEDYGHLLSTLMRILTDRLLREKELDDLSIDSPELQQIFDKSKHLMSHYVPKESKGGEGFPESRINLFGKWETTAFSVNQRFVIKYNIEHHEDRIFKGTFITQDVNGIEVHKTKMEGEWFRVLEVDKNLLLGIYLKYIGEDSRYYELLIPFHQMVGNAVIGTDKNSVKYTSKNMEPREGGF